MLLGIAYGPPVGLMGAADTDPEGSDRSCLVARAVRERARRARVLFNGAIADDALRSIRVIIY